MKHKLAKQLAKKFKISKDSPAWNALLEFSQLSEKHSRKNIRALARQNNQNIRVLQEKITDLKDEWGLPYC